jgi:hypothetical protein
VRLPRDITPGAAARRALLADLAIAICIALLALLLAAGVGVVAFVALPVLLIALAWIAIEAVVRGARRHSRRPRRSPGADRGQAV